MVSSKKYFHDHLVLLLLSINAFLAIGGAIYMLVSLSTGHNTSYIVQCRDCSNRDAVNRFTNGSVTHLLSLAVFAILVLVALVFLSLRTYKIHRQVAIAILSLGLVLLIFNVVVSYHLLAVR